MTLDSTVILGIPVDNLSLEKSVSEIFRMAEAYEHDSRPRLVVTIKADTLLHLQSRRNDDLSTPFMNALRQADLLIPMGAPVSWAARILGTSLKERFSGISFFRRLLSIFDVFGM